MKENLSKVRTSDLKEQLHKQFERVVIWWAAGGIFLLLGLVGLGDLVSHGLARLLGQEASALDPLVWLSACCLLVATCMGAVGLMYFKRYRAYNDAYKLRCESLAH